MSGYFSAQKIATTLSVIIVVAFGLIFYELTSGFRAVSSVGRARLALSQLPKPAPNIQLMNHQGERFRLSDFRNRYVLVNFIFTQCSGTCPVLVGRFAELRRYAQQASWGDRLTLLTVSWDIERDTPEKLAAYASAQTPSNVAWVFAVPINQSGTKRLLKEFGIWVKRLESGQFEHDSQIVLVGQEGLIQKSFPSNTPSHQLAETLAALIEDHG